MVISRIHLAQCVLAFLAGVIVSEASAQTLTTGSLERQTRPLSATAPTGPSGILTTVAGDGYPGDYGNGGMAVDAEFAGPQGIAVDGAGNLYVADSYAEVVRKVTASTGIITAFAGSGVGGYAGDGGPATSAALSFPTNVTVDAAGNVYIADSDNNVVRMVDAKTGIISTVAGDGLGAGPPSDHACRAYTDGLAATSASLCFPRGLAVDGAGNLYIGDTRQHRILVRNAKTGILTTVAGTGSTGYSGDGGLAVNAAISAPQQIAVDSTGNLYIADGGNCTIRKVTDGVIRTLVGAGPPATCGLAGDSGPASMAQMNYAYGVSVDAAGNVFIADGYNALIRMIAASTGNIYTVAGSYVPGASYGNLGFLGAGGPAVNGELYFPISAVVDNKDTLYLVDFYNYVVQAVNEAQVLPTESPAIAPVTGSIAKATTITITSPVKDSALYYTTNGTLPTTSSSKYTEPFSVAKTAVITAFATISGQPNTGASVSAYLYVPAPAITPGTETIHKATSVTINDADTKAQIYYTTDGSDPTAGGAGVALYTAPVSLTGTATLQAAAYSSATDSGGNLYSAWSPVVSATYTLVPLVVATPTFSLASGTYAKAQTVTLKDATAGAAIYYTLDDSTPTSNSSRYSSALTVSATETIKAIAVLSGETDSAVATAVYIINPDPGVIATIAGTGTAGNLGSGGPALKAELDGPFGIAFDASGNLYFSDFVNCLVHKVTPAGIITTIAGNGTRGSGGDGGPATSAVLNHPQGLAFDAAGDLYIADGGGSRIRKVTPAGLISTVAGTGTAGGIGDGGPATKAELRYSGAIAFDAAGNFYIADWGNNRIRMVTPAGIISTVAGNGTMGYTGDGGLALSAMLNQPQGIAVDAHGNIFVADQGNNVIREFTVGGKIKTVAGNGTAGYAGDGGPATGAELNSPNSVHVDASDNLYIADLVNNVIRKVTADGTITTIAGNGVMNYGGDGGSALKAELNQPTDAEIDPGGSLVITDFGNSRVRKVTY